MTHLSPASAADEDAADFNFFDGPSAGAAAVAGQDESRRICTLPAPHSWTKPYSNFQGVDVAPGPVVSNRAASPPTSATRKTASRGASVF